MLRDASYSLLISPDSEQRKKILAGEVRATIRMDLRDFKSGTMVLLACHLDPWCVMAIITHVSWCKVSEVPETTWRSAGYKSPEDMLTGLQRYYKTATWNSDVTVINWSDIKGKLVDEYMARKKRIQDASFMVCEEWKERFLAMCEGKDSTNFDFIDHVSGSVGDVCKKCEAALEHALDAAGRNAFELFKVSLGLDEEHRC